MPDYNALAATAKRLIDTSGRAAEFEKGGSSDNIPGRPWLGSSATDDPLPCTAVFIDDLSMFKDDDKVRATDKTALVSGTDFTDAGLVPAMGDRLDGLEIVSIRSVKPGAVALVYFLAVRGSP